MRKYRLKLIAISAYAPRHVRTLRALKHTLRRTHPSQQLTSARGRYLAYARARTARQGLILRRTFARWNLRWKRRRRLH